MKSSKITNFILEVSQVFLVFLGVYSALMCAALSLSLPVNRLAATLVLLGEPFYFMACLPCLRHFLMGNCMGSLGLQLFI